MIDLQWLHDHPTEVFECITKLEAENRELKAQVERLQDNASEIVDDYFDYIERYQIDSEDMNSSQKRKYDMMVALNSSIVATPAQCLAEIKAQGIMEALDYAKEKCSTYLDVDFYVMEYANLLTDAAKGE